MLCRRGHGGGHAAAPGQFGQIIHAARSGPRDQADPKRRGCFRITQRLMPPGNHNPRPATKPIKRMIRFLRIEPA